MATINENGYLAQPKTKMLCEKWAKRIALVESTTLEGKKMDLARRACLAKCLENTQQFIKGQLGEAVQSTDIGQYKRFALDIVTTVVPNLIAYDLVSVQPIDNRVGKLQPAHIA